MDENQTEEPWHSSLEKYVKNIRDIARLHSNLHEQSGYYFKQRNNWFGLPSVLIPLIMAPISLLVESANVSAIPFVNAGGFMLTGIFTGVYSFFKYGEQMERHFSFASRYSDIVTDIESELIRERKHRTPADVMIVKIKMALANLNTTAPVIPPRIVSENKKTNTNIVYEPIEINISETDSDIAKKLISN